MTRMSDLIKTLATLAPGRAWLVGGVLRDALLGRPLGDVDVTVEGDARSLSAQFSKKVGGHVFTLDEERGTYRVVLDTTLTFDFSRWQAPTLVGDLVQRDFTINALALDPTRWGQAQWKKHLIDPTGGQKDLQAKQIRLAGSRSFVEDPLRLLRAFRFFAELGFHLTDTTRRLARRHRSLITKSSPERVREELLRLLASPRAMDTLIALDDVGLLPILFPEVEPMRRTGRDFYGTNGVLAHSLAAVGSLEKLLQELSHQFPSFHRALKSYLEEPLGHHPRFAHLKLVTLFHDVGKPATAKKEGGKLHFYGHDAVGARLVRDIAQRFRFSNAETRSFSDQVGGHMRPGNLGHQPVLTDRAIFRFYRDFEDNGPALLIVSLADHFTYLSKRARLSRKDPVFKTIRTLLARYFLKRETVDPPKIINGNDLMKAFKLKPGPEVGRLLTAVREAQSTGTIKTPVEALALAKSLLT